MAVALTIRHRENSMVDRQPYGDNATKDQSPRLMLTQRGDPIAFP